MLNLEKLIASRESNVLEAKKAAGGLPHGMWATYSAFANTLGGIILLGVEEHQDHSLHLHGVADPQEMIRQIQSILSDPSQVSCNIMTSEQLYSQMASGVAIVVMEVPQASDADRPIFINNDPVNGVYRREEDGDYHCTQAEIAVMFREHRQDQ